VIRIILAFEIDCRQAGQMLYPYCGSSLIHPDLVIQTAWCQQGVVSDQFSVCSGQQFLASCFFGCLCRVGLAVVVHSVWVKHLTFCEELIV